MPALALLAVLGLTAAAPAGSATALAATSPAAASRVSATASPRGSSDIPDTPELRALRARADGLKADLERRTRDYEQALARARAARERATQLRQDAVAAAAEVARMQRTLSTFVAAAYRTGEVTEMAVILESDGEPSDLLHGMHYVREIRKEQNATLDALRAARATADRLAREAAQAAEEARRSSERVAADRARLEQRAAAAEQELARETRRVQQQMAAAAARARASAAAAYAAVARAAAGGFPNGMIPAGALCPLAVPGHLLQCDAADAFDALNAAYRKEFGTAVCVTDSYRSYTAQVAVYSSKPTLAAVPGTSNHGWGLALDLCGGIERFGTAQHAWMKKYADRFGWVHPGWAEPGGSKPEAWHWEFGNL
ncbi:MAG TPA: M15 family metallopeptidase [Mycobacteriales bacterium]|nr:M15 family metallopeptidase [Mycobacteriales bacterium]